MEKSYKQQSIAKGAFILGICGLIGKIIGALYRIPLTNIVGAQGMGLYQMVFPAYSLLLTISSTGMPSAIAKLISEKNAAGNTRGAKQVFKVSLISLLLIGATAAVILFFCSGFIARSQGNPAAELAYKGIAPAVVFVALICAYRGYFQGRLNMTPSAVSQIIEQAVKLAAGLVFAGLLLPRGVEYAALGALLGVTLSELVALLVLVINYMWFERKYTLDYSGEQKKSGDALRELYALSLPITLGGLILPLSQMIDSGLIINILVRRGADIAEATAAFGILTGPVGSLINMPAVLSLAIAGAVLPSISVSAAHGNMQRIQYKTAQAVKFCFIISLGGAAGLMILAEPVVRLLYSGGLTASELAFAAKLLRISSISVLYIGLSQVFTYVLQGIGRTLCPIIALGSGALVKLVLTLTLTGAFGAVGSAISNVACYAVSAIITAFFLKKHIAMSVNIRQIFLLPCVACGAMAAVAYLTVRLLSGLIGANAALFLAVCLGGAVFCLILVVFGSLTSSDIESMPFGKKLSRILRKMHLLRQ